MVSYSDAAKRDLLGVAEQLLAAEGAVSEPVAGAMAEGARSRFGADLSASITGIAGPGGEGSSKPVGLTVMDDDDLALALEQHGARDLALGVGDRPLGGSAHASPSRICWAR